MLKIVTFQGYTISALSIVAGDRRWESGYTVCENGALVRNANKVSVQASPHGAEIAAMISGIRYVQERARNAQNGAMAAGGVHY